VIARKNRFHGHRSVSKVRGSTIETPLLSIRFGKNKKGDYRLAVVVSKKVSGLAVTRNRIRRRLYELVRTQKALDGLSIDVVVYVKSPDVASVPHKKLSQEISELLKKAVQKTSQHRSSSKKQ